MRKKSMAIIFVRDDHVFWVVLVKGNNLPWVCVIMKLPILQLHFVNREKRTISGSSLWQNQHYHQNIKSRDNKKDTTKTRLHDDCGPTDDGQLSSKYIVNWSKWYSIWCFQVCLIMIHKRTDDLHINISVALHRIRAQQCKYKNFNI